MGLFDNVATDCRIGAPGNRICSAHAHKDTNNVLGGAVVMMLREEDRDTDQMNPHHQKHREDEFQKNKAI